MTDPTPQPPPGSHEVESLKAKVAELEGANGSGAMVTLENLLAEVQSMLTTTQQERDSLAARVDALEKALTRLRDCDWVITLPDRMDAVRSIAREALSSTPAADLAAHDEGVKRETVEKIISASMAGNPNADADYEKAERLFCYRAAGIEP